MKKVRLSIALLLTTLLMAGLTACSDNNGTADNGGRRLLTISVSDQGGYAANGGQASTRAIPYNTVRTNFEYSDAIGVFAVNRSTGTVTAANVKYVFDGNRWGSTTPIDYSTEYDYYAYFPYVASATDMPAKNASFTGSTAEAFFGSMIDGWTILDDQSTNANYNLCDLMVGKGEDLNNVFTITFPLKHQMSLAILKFGKVRYQIDDNYYWYENATHTIKGNYVFNYNGERRRIGKPGSTFTVSAKDDSWSKNIKFNSAGQYQVYEVAISEPGADIANEGFNYYEVKMGDAYYSDGSLSHTGKPEKIGQLIGIVCYVPATAEEQQVMGDGRYIHGLVISPKGYTVSWSDAEADFAAGDNALNQPNGWLTNTLQAVGDYAGLAKTAFLRQCYEASNHEAFTIIGDLDAAVRPVAASAAPNNVPNSGWFIGGFGQYFQLRSKVITIANKTEVTSGYAIKTNGTTLAINTTAGEAFGYLCKRLNTLFSDKGISNPFAAGIYWTNLNTTAFTTVSFFSNDRDISYIESWTGGGVGIYTSTPLVNSIPENAPVIPLLAF